MTNESKDEPPKQTRKCDNCRVELLLINDNFQLLHHNNNRPQYSRVCVDCSQTLQKSKSERFSRSKRLEVSKKVIDTGPTFRKCTKCARDLSLNEKNFDSVKRVKLENLIVFSMVCKRCTTGPVRRMCAVCSKELPLTKRNFGPKADNRFGSTCTLCLTNYSEKTRKQIADQKRIRKGMATKECLECSIVFPLDDEYFGLEDDSTYSHPHFTDECLTCLEKYKTKRGKDAEGSSDEVDTLLVLKKYVDKPIPQLTILVDAGPFIDWNNDEISSIRTYGDYLKFMDSLDLDTEDAPWSDSEDEKEEAINSHAEKLKGYKEHDIICNRDTIKEQVKENIVDKIGLYTGKEIKVNSQHFNAVLFIVNLTSKDETIKITLTIPKKIAKIDIEPKYIR